ncbi:aromatic-ring hydroxylase C-terminal domain-containing protein [Streptomyces sennicomposti]
MALATGRLASARAGQLGPPGYRGPRTSLVSPSDPVPAYLAHHYAPGADTGPTDEGTSDDRADATFVERLTGRPGMRVPHFWLHRNSRRISVLDLFEDRPTLLTGDGGQQGEGDALAWEEAAWAVTRRYGWPLAVHAVGPRGRLRPEAPADGIGRLGLGPTGATLVRLDGFVAWRCPHASERREQDLLVACARALGHAELWAGP